MFEIAALVFWSLFSSIITGLTAPEVAAPEDKRADTNVDAPTISEGTAIPVVLGTVMSARQNVSWFGGLGATKIIQSGVVTGHKYTLTSQQAICLGPVNDIREIRFDDILLPADTYTRTETTDYWDYNINAPELFGGEQQEGGVVGLLRIYKGTTTQVPNIPMTTLIGSQLPAYRRVCYAVFDNCYIGTSPRLKAPQFLIECVPNSLGLTGNKHIIGTRRDINAVCALYEMFTNPVWGARLTADEMDLPAWVAAAETAYAENLGISPMLTSPQDVDSAYANLQQYIDCTVFDDFATGKLTIRLVRESDLSGARSLTKSNVSKVAITRVGWSELANTIKVTFTDADRNYQTGGVMARNGVLTRVLGGATDLEKLDLPAFQRSDLAQRAAETALRSRSYPLSKLDLEGDHSLSSLLPGESFHLTWERPPINAYFRVTRVNVKELSEGGVSINAIEDVFTASDNTFTAPPASDWVQDTSLPRPIATTTLIETPYHLRRNDNRSLLFGALAPSSLHTGFKASVDSGAFSSTAYEFMARGALSSSIPQWSGATLSSLTLTMTLPDSVRTPTAPEYDAGEALLLIDNELLAYSTVTVNGNGTVTFGTITRGCLDTVPMAHASGAAVVVLKTLRLPVNLDATSDTAHTVSVISSTLAATQQTTSATSWSTTTNTRAARPIAPGAVAIGGTLWGAGPHTSPVTVAWEPRTRQATVVVSQTATGQTAESATDYVLKVYASDGTTLLETIETSSTSAAVTRTGNLVLDLRARRGGLLSYQGQRIPFNVIGPALLTEGSDIITTEAADRLITE